MFRHCTLLGCLQLSIVFGTGLLSVDDDFHRYGGMLISCLWVWMGMKESDDFGALARSVGFATAVKETTNFPCVGLLPSILAVALA